LTTPDRGDKVHAPEDRWGGAALPKDQMILKRTKQYPEKKQTGKNRTLKLMTSEGDGDTDLEGDGEEEGSGAEDPDLDVEEDSDPEEDLAGEGKYKKTGIYE
jgi:hypothetical protein